METTIVDAGAAISADHFQLQLVQTSAGPHCTRICKSESRVFRCHQYRLKDRTLPAGEGSAQKNEALPMLDMGNITNPD
eukprot:SAG31_NODE_7543_length_1659_cov_1.958333_1_plen_78_part_10